MRCFRRFVRGKYGSSPSCSPRRDYFCYTINDHLHTKCTDKCRYIQIRNNNTIYKTKYHTDRNNDQKNYPYI